MPLRPKRMPPASQPRNKRRQLAREASGRHTRAPQVRRACVSSLTLPSCGTWFGATYYRL